MPRDPKGQLGQRSTAKLPPGSLSVFFPNLANTVAEVGKLKPYGSGLEDPPAAGDPEPAPAAATAAAAPWAGPPLIGSRGRSSRARGRPSQQDTRSGRAAALRAARARCSARSHPEGANNPRLGRATAEETREGIGCPALWQGDSAWTPRGQPLETFRTKGRLAGAKLCASL